MGKITDNFLSKDEFSIIQNTLCGPTFAWYHQSKVTGSGNEENLLDTFFSHLLFSTARGLPRGVLSEHYHLFLPLIIGLEVNALIMLRVNNVPHTHKRIQYNFHTDTTYPLKTAILYVNTNNGVTILEDGTEVKSVENRVLSFDGQTKHCGTSCTDKRSRIVVNVNYI